MKALLLTLKSFTASFRDPNSMNYQDTLPFPPPTTIVGIIGAAIGKEFFQAQDYCRELSFGVVALGDSGLAKDQWAIRKIKVGGKNIGKAVVIREIMYLPTFKILVTGPDEKLLEMKHSFDNPVYPLSLGRDDEFITARESQIVDTVPTSGVCVHNTVIKGDISGRLHYRKDIAGEIPAFKTYWLCSSFERDPRNPMLRRPSNRAPFTFVNSQVIYEGEILSTNDLNIPVWR